MHTTMHNVLLCKSSSLPAKVAGRESNCLQAGGGRQLQRGNFPGRGSDAEGEGAKADSHTELNLSAQSNGIPSNLPTEVAK